MAPGNDMQETSKFCLKWDGFHSNITSVFENLRQDEELVDITLCCEGMKLKAHKMMLSAASPYFRDLLKENPCQHPVFFLRDTRCADMAAIIEFVYRGNVNVSQAQLASFIQTAELLQIRGLSGDEDGKQKESRPSSADPVPAEPPPSFRHRPPASPPATPHRYRAAPPPVVPGSPRPGAATPPAKRRRVATPPPPPPPQPALAATAEPAAPPPPPPPPPPELPEVQEVLVKQEKVEEVEDGAAVYDSAVQSSLEQMIFMPQHPRVMSTSAPPAGSAISTPSNPVIASEEPSQAMFGCRVCGAQYKSSYSLAQHARVHEGLTLCPVCGVAQSRVTNLRRHLMIRHNLSRERACEMVPLSGSGERYDLGLAAQRRQYGAEDQRPELLSVMTSGTGADNVQAGTADRPDRTY